MTPPIPPSLDCLHARARALADRIVAEASSEAPVDLRRYTALASAPASARYTELAAGLLEEDVRLRGASPEAATRRNRALLAELIARFEWRDARCALPPSVMALYPAHFERMLAQVELGEDALFSLDDDRFLKDLAIVQHRLVPVGAELAQLDSGVPRSVLLSGGPAQWLRGLWFLHARAGGLRPFFELHMHMLVLEEFNPEGWHRTYLRLGDLLAYNPRSRGWISVSWFLDPRLEEVSPRLAYLRQVPVSGGASLFYVTRDEQGTSGALTKSVTRRERFRNGDYVPTIYLRAWPRRAVRRWCASQTGLRSKSQGREASP